MRKIESGEKEVDLNVPRRFEDSHGGIKCVLYVYQRTTTSTMYAVASVGRSINNLSIIDHTAGLGLVTTMNDRDACNNFKAIPMKSFLCAEF